VVDEIGSPRFLSGVSPGGDGGRLGENWLKVLEGDEEMFLRSTEAKALSLCLTCRERIAREKEGTCG